jgi:hypothetical protein
MGGWLSAVSLVDTSSHNEINRLFRGRNRELAHHLIRIIIELMDYWPLTVRQVYYQAVARLLIANALAEYQRVSKLLTTLRRNDLVSWDAIEDRTRRTTDKRGVPGLSDFITEQSDYFLNWRYYHRCRVQEQDVYLEAAIEKDALSSIVEDVLWPYCTRLNVVRGQVSATMAHDMSLRFDSAYRNGQRPVLLYFGDLDPSGVTIPVSLIEKMKEHHTVDVTLDRRALNPRQIDEFNLPESFEAAKSADPNYARWIRNYPGVPATELDALHPGVLRELVKDAVESHLDMGSFREQMEIEEQERERLKIMRRNVIGYARKQYPGSLLSGKNTVHQV